MSKMLEIVVNLKGNDGLSSILRNVSGVGSAAEARMKNLTKDIAAQTKEVERLDKAYQAALKNGGGNAHIHALAHRDAIEKKNQLIETRRRERDAINNREKYKRWGDKMVSSGKDDMIRGAFIGAPVAYAIKSAADFETSMTGAKKVLNDWTPAGLKALNNQVLDLSSNLGIAAPNLAKIVEAAGQDGVGAFAAQKGNIKEANQELLNFATSAAKMSVAFDISQEQAGGYMQQWRAAMGLNQGQINTLADQINMFANASKGGKESEIADTISRIGSLTKIGGIHSGDLAAMASLESAIGKSPEEAGTGIKNMMLALVHGSEHLSDKKADAWAKIGLNPDTIAQEMQTDSRSAILDVLNRINQIPKWQQANLLETMFGREGLLAISPMLSELPELKHKFDMVSDPKNYKNSMNTEFAGQQNTMAYQGNKLMMMAGNALTKQGGVYSDEIIKAEIGGQNAIANITNFAEKHRKLTDFVFKSVASLAAFNLGLGALKIGFGNILPMFGKLNAFSIAKSGKGIFSLLGGGVKIGFDLAKLGGSKLLGGLRSLGTGIIKTGPLIMRGASLIKSGIFGLARALWVGGAALLANPITPWIIGFVAAAALLWVGAYYLYKNWDKIKKWGNSAKKWLATTWSNIKTAAQKNPLAPLAFGIAGAAVSIITNWGKIRVAFQVSISIIKNTWDNIKASSQSGIAYISNLSSAFFNAGQHMLDGLINGIKSKVAGAKAAILDAASQLKSAFTGAMGIRSPSRVFMQYGGYISQGAALGINRYAPSVWSAAKTMAKGAILAGAMTAPALAMPSPAKIAQLRPVAQKMASEIKIEQGAIVVNALPHQSPQDIAKAVGIEVQRIIKAQKSRANTSFQDSDYFG